MDDESLVAAAGGGIAELSTGRAGQPFVGVCEQVHSLRVAHRLKIGRSLRGRPAIAHAVDSARVTIDSGVVVAFSGVAPVDEIDRAVGSVGDLDANHPGIGRMEHVGRVTANVAAALAIELLDVHAAAVLIEREEFSLILLGPLSATVDGHTDMRMATATAIVLAASGA